MDELMKRMPKNVNDIREHKHSKMFYKETSRETSRENSREITRKNSQEKSPTPISPLMSDDPMNIQESNTDFAKSKVLFRDKLWNGELNTKSQSLANVPPRLHLPRDPSSRDSFELWREAKSGLSPGQRRASKYLPEMEPIYRG